MVFVGGWRGVVGVSCWRFGLVSRKVWCAAVGVVGCAVGVPSGVEKVLVGSDEADCVVFVG